MKPTQTINSAVRRMFLLIVLLVAFLPVSASDGDQFSCDGLWFEVLSESQKAVAVIAPRNNQYTSEDIAIPETIKHPQTASLYTVAEIGTYAFHSCSELASVTVPNTITAIGNYAFYGCSKLSSVTIPNSITAIGNYAFCNCSKLASVTIPNSVTTIGIKAFEGCSSLKSVALGSSVDEAAMSNSCLLYCSKLVARLDVSKDNPYICSADDAVYSKDKTVLYRLAPGRKGTSFTVPNSVTAVVSNAFDGCSALASMTIEMTNVSNIFVSKLKTLTFTEHVESLKNCQFDVEDAVYCLTKIPPVFTAYYSKGRFSEDTYNNAMLYVPTGRGFKYVITDGWKEFKNIEEMDSGVEDVVDEEAVIRVVDGCIVIDGAASDASVEVYDMTGKAVYRGAAAEIPSMPRGIYIVRIGVKSVKVAV